MAEATPIERRYTAATPLQIGRHLVRTFEAGFEVGAKPVEERVVEAMLSL